jgi:hypothetical protein
MTTPKLTRGRILALGIFTAVFIAPVFLLVIGLAHAYLGEWSKLSAMSALAADYRQAIAEGPHMNKDIEVLKDALSVAKVFYEDESTETSTARLGQNVKEAIQQAGGDLRTESMNAVVKEDQVEKLEISVDATLRSADLPKLLSALQAQRPFLAVDALNISVAQFSGGQGWLWLTMTISAFHRAPHA